MKVNIHKTITLELTDHEGWMLEGILSEFVKMRASEVVAGDSFDKFALDASEKINTELALKI